jgi:hypothetical protein
MNCETLIFQTARLCHEANRVWCTLNGDHTQYPWNEAPEWQRESAIAGVRFHIANPTAGPEASHENWVTLKLAEGWAYGPEKSPAKKLHPCIVPFSSLPTYQQTKDRIFRALVHAVCGELCMETYPGLEKK